MCFTNKDEAFIARDVLILNATWVVRRRSDVDSLMRPLDLAIDKDQGLKFLRHLTFWIGSETWHMNGLEASSQFALQL